MKPTISFNRNEESLDAKARWFQSLTLEERMEYFSDFMDFILEANPDLANRANAQQVSDGILVLNRPGTE